MGPIAAAALGIGTGLIEDLQQFGFQQAYNRQQMSNSKELMRQQHAYALEMWKQTGPQGMMEQYKKAGLNPGLMYGMSGGGAGQTTMPNAQGPGGHATKNDIMGMGIAAMQAAAQVKVLESQANLNNTQAKKLSGVDTTEAQARIDNLMQGLDNLKEDWVIKRLQQTMMNMQNWEQQATQADRLRTITYNADQAFHALGVLKNEHKISDATIEDKIKIIQREAIFMALKNELTTSQRQLTDQELMNRVNDILISWEKIGNDKQELFIKGKLADFETDDMQRIVENMTKIVNGVITGAAIQSLRGGRLNTVEGFGRGNR